MTKLAVFDFDYTIIDDNSDTAVMHLLDTTKIPKSVKELHRTDGWTTYMQGIFKLLHQYNIHESIVVDKIKKLPPVSGMKELIKKLKNSNYDIIIISDSNSYFINLWLETNNLTSFIDRVYTNPAKYVDGILNISMYHLQTHCKLSTKNLCKGQILEDFINEQKNKNKNYNRIIYCGDGVNDLCPILYLSSTDLACIRENYKCINLIRKLQSDVDNADKDLLNRLKTEIFVWTDGFQIINKLN